MLTRDNLTLPIAALTVSADPLPHEDGALEGEEAAQLPPNDDPRPFRLRQNLAPAVADRGGGVSAGDKNWGDLESLNKKV